MTQPRVLTVLSWNVLADKYALPERYPEIEERYLARKPRSRHTEIIVARSHADVICLQEVDVKLFEMLERTLGADGYQSDFAPMTPNMVGVATFIAPPFGYKQSVHHRFIEKREHDASGHIALITLLTDEDGETMLTIANTHLIWDAPGVAPQERVAPRQSKELLNLCRQYPHPVVVCMEANARPESDVLSPFFSAGFLDAHPASYHTFNRPDRVADAPHALSPRKIDYILYEQTAGFTPAYPTRLSGAEPLTADRAIPDARMPSDHLPLSAAFRVADARSEP